MTAYYNEFDPYPAQWLRNLSEKNLIARGVVDERSIKDVRVEDLNGYAQCHWFGGIGGWSLALRLAGVPDDYPLWTGSCPCQPFSVAGKGKGFADERHLWPVWFDLIRQCRPPIIFGEQVGGTAGLTWLDAVFADLEGIGYACGAANLPAASVGAPHIRQRLFFVAYRRRSGLEVERIEQARGELTSVERSGAAGSVGDSDEAGCPIVGCGALQDTGKTLRNDSDGRSEGGGLADDRSEGNGSSALAYTHGGLEGNGELQRGRGYLQRPQDAPTGFWANVVWLPCSDGKARPISAAQSDIILLADGFWYRLADVRAEFIAQAKREVIAHAEKTQKDYSEVLSAVQQALREKEVHCYRGSSGGQTGGPLCISTQTLLQYSLWDALATREQSTTDRGSESEENATESPTYLRDLRLQITFVCSSLRRESDEQPAGESTNPVSVLSRFLARCGQEIEDLPSRANACAFPLSNGKIEGRTGMLRGFGNAIVPVVAAEFIKAALDLP